MNKKRRRAATSVRRRALLLAKNEGAKDSVHQMESWIFTTPETTCTLILTLDASAGPKGLQRQYRQYIVSCDHCKRSFRISMPVRPHASEGVEIAGVYAPAHAWRQLFQKVLGKAPRKKR